jgi:hypothetical protein
MSRLDPPFAVLHSVQPASVVLSVQGNLNEAFEPARELERVAQTVRQAGDDLPIALDLGKVNRMNSVAVRQWCLFVSELQNRYPIRFLRLSESFIELTGVVLALLGEQPVEIDEFEIPFFCARCSERFAKMGDASEVDDSLQWTGQSDPPCPKCGGPAALDCVPTEYFHFLKRLKRD